MRKVLCVCVGNSSRSPMMQAVLQQHLGEGFQVESAGVQVTAGRSANPRSILVMGERGVDLSRHERRWIGDLDLSQYSHIVCVGQDEADRVRDVLGEGARPVVLVANGEKGGIPDPYELGLPGYRECLALLDRVMPRVAREIR